jgi:hypothetical protein
MIQGNRFWDFLESSTQLIVCPALAVSEGKIKKMIFPSESKPNLHFTELHLLV